LMAAFVIAGISTAAFWAATGPISLLVARLIQGVASGTAMSVLAAALVDHAPPSRPHLATTVTVVGTSLGLAGGGAFVGMLMQWTSRPDLIVFPLLTAIFAALAVASWVLPEARSAQTGHVPTWRPGVRLRSDARSEFWAAAPTSVAGWAATGLFLALVPSLVRDEFHVGLEGAGGLVIAGLYVAVTVGGLWSARLRARTATAYGAVSLALGAVALGAAVAATSAVEFAAGSLAIGLGVGLTFNGNLRSISAVTSPDSRAETFAAVYVLSYASLAVPTLVAGLAAPGFGMRPTTYAFLAFLAILSAAAVVLGLASGNVRHAHSNSGTGAARRAGRQQ
jgi:MFS family permease